MPTKPDRVRHGLQLVTAAAQADLRAVAAAAKGESPATIRAALFAAAPLLVDEYSDGAAALALDWYEEFREAANVVQAFTPLPLRSVTDEDVAAMVAEATSALHDLEDRIASEVEALVEEATRSSLTLVEDGLQQQVADGFRETITGNSAKDPASAGWKRFAQPGACKFCRMLAARGGVFTRETARFASHTTCHCIAGPEFGGQNEWAEATPMQYVASKRRRTAKERADLRKYLNQNFPDSPG